MSGTISHVYFYIVCTSLKTYNHQQLFFLIYLQDHSNSPSLSPKLPISGQLLQLNVPVEAGLTLQIDPKLSEWIMKTEFAP